MMETTGSIEITPAAAIRGREAYRRKTSPRPIDLRLDANEGGTFAAEIVASSTMSPDAVRRYPDASVLEAALAKRHGIDPEQVVVTAGADDALERVCRAMLEPGRRAAYCMPSFEMLRRYVRTAGAEAIEIDWPGGAFPTARVIEAGRDADVLFVVSPNNPTGAVATPDDLRQLRERLPRALIVVDAAYGEFADEDLTEMALAMPWTIVTRTFSKAWGAAGIRVGYSIGDRRVIDWLRAAGQPYAVSGVSIEIALKLLESEERQMRAFVDRVGREREELFELLKSLGAEPIESQANFVLARFSNANLTADLLEGLGIAVRRFAPETGLSDSLRIGCPGDAAAFGRLKRAQCAALRPQAILFDLDGVLADVSRSYREAIRLTAAEFGVTVTPADIAAVKAAGDANNDWVVTQRLLRSAGVEISFDRVKAVFERLYQGDANRPGLCKTEALLWTREALAALRERFRLGIVTGRPRADATRFLKMHDITDLFDTVVCMEDSALKPDPAPVRLALQQLRVESAWMIGDTPDDVVAARAAGVIPIGCIPPGAPRDQIEPVLLRSGAARVLDGIDRLPEILP